MSDNNWNIMGDDIPHNTPYDHDTPQKEKGTIQNKLKKRRQRRRLKLAAARSCKKEAISKTFSFVKLW